MQLSSIKNVEFGGEYFADQNGYYTDGGFSGVNLQGRSTVRTPWWRRATSGRHLRTGHNGPPISRGCPAEGHRRLFQKNPFCMLRLAEGKPVITLADMDGKKFGIQAGANQPVLNAFLKANDLDPPP